MGKSPKSTMNAIFAVQLFILVWTFTAVCQDDEDISVSCYDLTGSVGKEVTLSCSVSLKNTECCIKMYKFQYPETFNDSSICRQDVSVNSCEQRNSFTCRYTPSTAMKEQFRFLVQTKCGVKRTEFTLDTDISVSCDYVTGSVGKEVNLTCSVSLQNTECCITMHKFQYPEIFNDSEICRQDVSVNSCEQRNSFTCPYTPPTEMKEQFRFFVQTKCGTGKAEIFTLNTVSSGRVDPENPSGSSPPESAPRFKGTVIAVAMAGFIIILIFIMMVIIHQTKPNSTKLCRGQNWMFLRVRHDEDNNRPGNEIL